MRAQRNKRLYILFGLALLVLCLLTLKFFSGKQSFQSSLTTRSQTVFNKQEVTQVTTLLKKSEPAVTIQIPNPEQVSFSPEDEQLMSIYIHHLEQLLSRVPASELQKKILLHTNYPLNFQQRIQEELAVLIKEKNVQHTEVETFEIDVQLYTHEPEGEEQLVLEVLLEEFEDSSFKLRGKAYHAQFSQQLNYQVTPTAYGTWNYRIFS